MISEQNALFLTLHVCLCVVFSYATVWVFVCLCAQMCIHQVRQGWNWGAELRGWQRTEGLGWLACDYSGCQVFTERWREGGGTETAGFTLYCKPHTHTQTHMHLHRGPELQWKPHKPWSVYVCVFVLQLARWDQWLRMTHIRSPTTVEHSVGWMGERPMDADLPGQLHSLDFCSISHKDVCCYTCPFSIWIMASKTCLA